MKYTLYIDEGHDEEIIVYAHSRTELVESLEKLIALGGQVDLQRVDDVLLIIADKDIEHGEPLPSFIFRLHYTICRIK